jgi:hypothetical protein
VLSQPLINANVTFFVKEQPQVYHTNEEGHSSPLPLFELKMKETEAQSEDR